MCNPYKNKNGASSIYFSMNYPELELLHSEINLLLLVQQTSQNNIQKHHSLHIYKVNPPFYPFHNKYFE